MTAEKRFGGCGAFDVVCWNFAVTGGGFGGSNPFGGQSQGQPQMPPGGRVPSAPPGPGTQFPPPRTTLPPPPPPGPQQGAGPGRAPSDPFQGPQQPAPQWGGPGGPLQQPGSGGFGTPTGSGPRFAPTQFGVPPSGKRRLRLPSTKGGRIVLAAGAIGTIAVLVAAGVLIFSGGGKGTDTASGAVEAYLDALIKGDADRVMALTKVNPPDKTFLTDEILKKQMEKYPITNIKILGDVPVSNGNHMVHVIADFGGVPSDGKIRLTKPAEGQGWKLDGGITAVDVGGSSGTTSKETLALVTIFGKPLPKTGKAYTFPGWIELGSTNPNLKVINSRDGGPPSISSINDGSSLVFPDVALSDEGKKAITDQLNALGEKCTSSSEAAPAGCPAKVPDFYEARNVKWTGPPSIADEMDVSFDKSTGKVKFYGGVDFNASFTGKYGPDTYNSILFLEGTVDITQNPPKVELAK